MHTWDELIKSRYNWNSSTRENTTITITNKQTTLATFKHLGCNNPPHTIPNISRETHDFMMHTISF